MSSPNPHSSIRIPHSILDLLFNQLHSGIALLNPELEILYMNPACERLFSFSLKWAQQKKIYTLLPHNQDLEKSLKKIIQNERAIKIHELEIKLKEKTIKTETELIPMENHSSKLGILMWVNELSTVESLQEEKRLKDRLAMLGTMASGLAHEIRNPLGSIRGAAQMLNREIKNKEAREYTSIIISEADRLNRLVTNLLDFGKSKAVQFKALNLNQILSQILKLQSEAFQKNNIELLELFDPSLPKILGESDGLKQVFLNLIQNATEAMPQGGTLTIGTHYHPHVPGLLGKGKSGPMGEVRIEDTGVGIPKKNLDSLFTPFFTTKNHGTGLGLMITQKIIQEHQGHLRVKSKVNHGSTFHVFLRLAK